MVELPVKGQLREIKSFCVYVCLIFDNKSKALLHGSPKPQRVFYGAAASFPHHLPFLQPQMAEGCLELSTGGTDNVGL